MTAIYVIAALVVLVFLYGAYRMMGAGATVEEDPRAVLGAVLGTATEAAQVLDGTPGTGDDASSPHAVRRRLDGCAQALERIAGIPVDATLDEARTALELAVDELSWAARLAEAPGVREGQRAARCRHEPAKSRFGQPGTRPVAARRLARRPEVVDRGAHPSSKVIEALQPRRSRVRLAFPGTSVVAPRFRGTVLGRNGDAGRLGQHAIERVDVGLDAGADVVDPRGSVDRREIGTHHVLNVDVVSVCVPSPLITTGAPCTSRVAKMATTPASPCGSWRGP